MTDADICDRLRLARTEGIGPVTFRRLLQQFRSPAAAIEALPSLARAAGRKGALLLPDAGAIRGEIDRVARFGGRLLFLDDPDYPALLAMLDDAPSVLTVLGDISALQARAVAVVGGRNASANGQRMAEILSADLAMAGLVVVSGMARGVDAAAHEGALRTGRTVAAIAGGIDVAYPRENADLQRRVAEGGAVVAEAPFGTAPQSRHFPRRNRIIAGLSLGVVVVEAAPRSGSLITARLALETGRDVFAVPGSPLDPRCRGSNHLLRSGATLTESATDVIEVLPDYSNEQAIARLRRAPEADETDAEPSHWPLQGPDELDPARTQVLKLLSPSPTAVDDLVRRCQFSASAVMAVLLELELARRVEMLPGNRVCLLDSEHSD